MDHHKLIEQLERAIEFLQLPESDTTWSRFQTPDEAITFVKLLITKLQHKDRSALAEVNLLFAPTGAFQEIAMQSGWSDEYMAMAFSVDQIMVSIKL